MSKAKDSSSSFDLAALFDEVREVEVKCELGTTEVVLHVKYRPHHYDSRVHSAIQDFQEDTGKLEHLVDVLCGAEGAETGLLSDWDILNGGEKLPITREGVRRLPIRLVVEISAAILQDIADPKRDATSDAS